MKKMIFLVSALALSQSVVADTFPSTSSTAPAPAAATTTTTTTTTSTNTEATSADADANGNANADLNKVQHHKKHARHVYAAVATKCKDQAPKEECKPCCFLDNLSGNMTMTSNYVFRGVSQTRNLPAVQGSLTYQFPIGFYLNAWGSNVKFQDTDATLELDSIIGWRGDFWEDFSYDLNLDRYNYPGASELSYLEFNSVFNYKIFQFGYSYSDNVYATHGPGRYYIFGINYDIPCQYILGMQNISIHATAGHYTLPKAAGDSYNDYSIWLSKKLKIYTLTLQWTDTNGRQHNPPYDSAHIFLMLGAEF